MNIYKTVKFFKSIVLTSTAICALGLGTVYAKPTHFTTDNRTPYPSNAEIKGTMAPFERSTPSNQVRKVDWGDIELLCWYDFSSPCQAKIYMFPNGLGTTGVLVGEGQLDLNTGELTPKEISMNGYKLTSPEPAKIVIEVAG